MALADICLYTFTYSNTYVYGKANKRANVFLFVVKKNTSIVAVCESALRVVVPVRARARGVGAVREMKIVCTCVWALQVVTCREPSCVRVLQCVRVRVYATVREVDRAMECKKCR